MNQNKQEEIKDKTTKKGEGRTKLHEAAADGDVDVILAILVSEKEIINKQASSGYTPLHEAIKKQHKEAATILLQHGASITPQDAHGRTALHLCCEGNHEDLACLCVSLGSDSLSVDCQG
eukprot:TRINITY_DN2419_c0_g1_i3.p1 TRINITY_DN2419_c0_g1~~TRINITY_DN2419_c0_g1_i3.p1  ORF type:complete len:120 (+),score=45.25 TRINITY_DN2419_c0_g1_i3:44-403(+)